MGYYKAIGVNGKPDETEKSCFDCFYCQANISWWCRNKDAIKARGTAIPGVANCPYWKPMQLYKDLKWHRKILSRFDPSVIFINLN